MTEESSTQDNITAGDKAAEREAAPAVATPQAGDASNGETFDPASRQDDEDERAINEATANFGDGSSVNKLFVGSSISVHEHYEAIVTESGDGFTRLAFSTEHCAPLSPQREKELEEVFVGEEWLTSELLNTLFARRFLILAGEPEAGKKSLALYLSHKVRKVEKTCRETFLVSPLQRKVKLELQKVAEDKKDFSQRVTIFPQIGESDNRDLLDLFARLKGVEQLDKIYDALEQNKSFFLFTVDAHHVKTLKEDLKRLGVLHEIPAPPARLLEIGLEKKVTQFLACKSVSRETAEAAWALITANKNTLLTRLPKMSQLARFIDSYLLGVVDKDQALDLSSAIDSVESHEKWFVEDLGKDFDTWCFTFTLGLCQCGAETEGVPWLEFDAIRREITKHLSRELRAWRHIQPEEATFTKLLDEKRLLEKCRARIVHEAGVSDFVRFDDSRYPDKLWEIFTHSNRRLLTLILPVLQGLAQSPDTQIRARAARILGRVGEINPVHITITAIESWSTAKPLRQKAAVGYLLEGAFTSHDESYKQICRTRLEDMSRSGNTDRLWTAIAAYKQLGRGGGEKLAYAVAKLGEITERNFSEWMGWKKKFEQLEHQLETLTQKKKKDPQELVAAAAGAQALKELRNALRRAYDEDDRIMFAICYSLVALALQVGAFAIMVELNKWYMQGHQSLAVLTSWIFWMEEGIADSLAEYRVPVPGGVTIKGTPYDCHAVVASLGIAAQTEPQAISQTTRFLVSTYNQFPNFHTRTRQLLRRKFLLHLKRWADSAWAVTEYRQVMLDLYTELLCSPHMELASNLADYLKNDPEFNTKAHLKRFADSVLQNCRKTGVRPVSLVS